MRRAIARSNANERLRGDATPGEARGENVCTVCAYEFSHEKANLLNSRKVKTYAERGLFTTFNIIREQYKNNSIYARENSRKK